MQFELSLDDCCNFFGCSFGKKGWHHLVETILQIDNNPSISLSDTILFKYHSRFKPYGIADCVTKRNLMFKPPWGIYPWGSFKYGNIEEPTNRHRTRFCGPSSSELVEKEFNQIVYLYNKLKVEGYNPWSHGNSHISGVMLKNKNRKSKMVIVQGNPRLAALSALGYDRVPIRLFEG